MLQIPLSNLAITPGHIQHWKLRAPIDEFDPTLHGQKVASYNQDKHFSAALAARAEHAAENYWVAMTFQIPGRVDLTSLEAALYQFVQRHEVLRSSFERLAGDLRCDVMTPADVALDHTDAGFFSSAEAVLAHLEATFDKEINTLSWPLFLTGVVVAEALSTVFMAFDHIVCDGLSLAVAVDEVQQFYANISSGRRLALDEAGSYLDFGLTQRCRYAGLTADGPELSYWRSFIAEAGGMFPRIPLDFGVEPGRMYPAHNQTVQLLDNAHAAAFERLCAGSGARLFMGLLAAVGMSLHQVSGCDVYHGFLPVSERKDPRWRGSFGWFVNTMPITFPVSGNLSFTAVLDAVRVGFQTLIRHVDVPFVKAWELLAPEYYHLRTWPFPVNFFSFIDYRRVPGAANHSVWQPTTIPQASHSNTGNMWFYRNSDGIYLNSIFVDTPQCRRAMTSYQGAIAQTVTALATPT
jgi:hypothetical protein